MTSEPHPHPVLYIGVSEPTTTVYTTATPFQKRPNDLTITIVLDANDNRALDIAVFYESFLNL